MSFRNGSFAAVILLSMAGSAWAAPITYLFTGTVTAVDASLSGTFNTSQTLSGSLTYESTASGNLCGGCSQGNGFSDYSGALIAMDFNVGSYVSNTPTTQLMQVVNNFGGLDRFVVSTRLTGTQMNGFSPLVGFFLEDSSLGAFSDTILANVGSLNGWPGQPNHFGSWYLAFSAGGGQPKVDGLITSVTSSAAVGVPEPGGLALVAGGLALIAGRRRVRTLLR